MSASGTRALCGWFAAVAVGASALWGCGEDLSEADTQRLGRDTEAIISACRHDSPLSPAERDALTPHVASLVEVATHHPDAKYTRPGGGYDESWPALELEYLASYLAGREANPVCSMRLAEMANKALVSLGRPSVL